MLVRLAEHVSHMGDFLNPQFDLRSEDDHGSLRRLQDFLDDANAHERYEEMSNEVAQLVPAVGVTMLGESDTGNVSDGEASQAFASHEYAERISEQLQPTLRWMADQIKEADRQANGIAALLSPLAHPRRRLIWEVYASEGLISSFLQPRGGCRGHAFWS